MLRLLGSSRATSTFTAFAFLVALLLPAISAHAQDDGTVPANYAQRQAEYRTIADLLDRFYAGVEVVSEAVDRSRFDIDALAEKIGPDPANLLSYVQENIAFEPYIGNLRGARGALGSAAANSLDRSLLLAELLKRSGFEAEIVRGRLSEKHAETLLHRVGLPVPQHPDPLTVDTAFLQSLVGATGITVDDLLAAAKQMEDRGREIDLALSERVAEDEAFLNRHLNAAGVTMPAPATLDTLVPVVSDHFWVRYRESDDNWNNLDPSFAGNPAGLAVASPEATFAPGAVPEELVHEFALRMILRIAEGDNEIDNVLLEHRLSIPDVYGLRINLANRPLPNPAEAVLAGKAVENALADINEISTILIVGETPIAGKFFNARGDLFDNPPGGDAGNAERLNKLQEEGLGKSTETLETIFDRPGQPGEPSRKIVKQWVEYLLSSPTLDGKRKTRANSRPIFPRQSIRASSDADPVLQHIVWSAEILPIVGPMSVDQFGRSQLDALVSGRDSTMAMLRRSMVLPVDQSVIKDLGVPAPSLSIFGTALSTRLAEFQSSRYSHLTVLWGQPQLIAFETTLINLSGMPVRFIEGYDIIALELKAITKDLAANPGSFAVTLGALANSLEWSLLKHRKDMFFDDHDVRVANTGEVLRAAIEQGIDVITLHPSEDSPANLEQHTVPPDDAKRITDALASGHLVIAPVTPVPIEGSDDRSFGWWQANLETGEIIGFMQGGRGAGETERIGLLRASITGVAGTLVCSLGLFASGVRPSTAAGAAAHTLCILTGIGVAAGLRGAVGTASGAEIGIAMSLLVIFAGYLDGMIRDLAVNRSSVPASGSPDSNGPDDLILVPKKN